MLGAPISFWDLQEEDDFASTLLMGLAAISNESCSTPVSSYHLIFFKALLFYEFRNDSILFRPPLAAL
jgi:hypothetical protein